jgi:hypothetical protein
MSSYLTTSVASATYQTLECLCFNGGTGYSRFPSTYNEARFPWPVHWYIGLAIRFFFSAIIPALTLDIINLVDDRLFTTF